MKMVRIMRPETCRLVAEVTKDPNHVGKCPIEMTKDQWLAIKPSVDRKRQSQPDIMKMFRDIFDGMTK